MDHASFRALARSSPYLWREIEMEFREGRSQLGAVVRLASPTVRAHLRVWELDSGSVLTDEDVSDRNYSWSLLSLPGVSPDVLAAAQQEHLAELDSTLVWRADGLVEVRPEEPGGPGEPPIWGNFRWVAVLDPRELADGDFTESDYAQGRDHGPRPAGVEIGELCAVTHHGRPAWQARVRALETYAPRCSCCPILVTPASDEIMDRLHPDPDFYPDSYLVRLDRATGICVWSQPQGCTPADAVDGHDIRLVRVELSAG